MNLGKTSLGMVCALAWAVPVLGDFDAKNLVVVRVGDGLSPYEKGSAAPVFLDEIDPATGAVVRSIALPTEPGGSQKRLTLSLSATSEGALALSKDGRYLTLVGYDAPLLMAKVHGSPSDIVSRVVARVDGAGRVDTSTAIADGYSRNNVRGAVTIEGRRFYVAGAGKGGGTRVVEFGSEGASNLLGEAPENTRGVGIFDGQLYASAGSGAFKGIVAVGLGVPSEGGQTSTLIAPSPVAVAVAVEPKPDGIIPKAPPEKEPKPSGFVFLGGRLYVADLETGLLDYEPESAPATGPTRYRLAAKHPLPNLSCLTGQLVDGKPVLYGTDGERLVRIVGDEKGFRTTVVASAGPNQAFRGVAFPPTLFEESAIPLGVLVALGAAGLIIPGAVIFALRRRARRRVRFEGTDVMVEGGPI